MELIETLKNNTDKEHWVEGGLWFGWTIACGLLPLWATIFFLFLYKQDIQAKYLTDHGEFALYTASYIGGCLYIVIKDFKKTVFPSKAIITLMLVVLLLLSSFMFSQITTTSLMSTMSNSEGVDLIDPSAIRIVSYIILPLSLILAYLIMVAENVRIGSDYTKITEQQRDKLIKQFDSIQD